jgi:hypothetical protein
MLNPLNGKLIFAPFWDEEPEAACYNFQLPYWLHITDTPIFGLKIPSTLPPVQVPATYRFAVGATKPGTLEFMSNISIVTFEVQ